jgi:hypothetical protein
MNENMEITKSDQSHKSYKEQNIMTWKHEFFEISELEPGTYMHEE